MNMNYRGVQLTAGIGLEECFLVSELTLRKFFARFQKLFLMDFWGFQEILLGM